VAKVAAGDTAAPAPAKTDAAAVPVTAGRDTAVVLSPPPALPPAKPAPVSPVAKVTGEIKAASDKAAAAAMPAAADRESPAKKNLPKIISEAETPAQAGKPSRAELKSAAPLPALQKSRPPVMVRTAPTEPSKREILLQQILVVSPVLNRLCCPLTEKLFWKIGD
jgi:hypothetical protein